SVAVRGHDGISRIDESGRGAVHRRRYAPTPASSTSSATPWRPRRAILLQPCVARREHGDLLRRVEFDLVERRAPGPLGLGSQRRLGYDTVNDVERDPWLPLGGQHFL